MSARTWTPWRVVIMFGGVSLAADMVYEGARSMYGPLLAALGASALVVGLVTGAGEAMALVLRFVFGPLADRTGRYWALTILGYAMTAVCVPLLAVTPFLGGAGLAVGIVLILLERSGKAVRSPSKSALLAHVATGVGRGRGFGVHKAMDQVGAFAGPLVVAGVIAVSGALWPAFLVLAVPGAAAMVLLAVLRARVPDPSVYDGSARPGSAGAPGQEPPSSAAGPAHPPGYDAPDGATTDPPDPAPRGLRAWLAESVGAGLPPEFFRYAAAASLTTGGLVTFGVISFHLTTDGLVPVATVPLIYAGAMAVEALAALAVGSAYDRLGSRVLYVVPVLVALVPALALSSALAAVLVGVVVWGFAFGVQDSTVKALVAELVDAPRRATAYGVFAGIQGALAVVGGGVVGWLYEVSLPALVVVVAISQAVALVLLVTTLRRAPAPAGARPSR
ncbi:MFS transporter [Georgenia soli]|uniref:MFS transporter n=1 Tax=Georgenia soli TaxID=638953 RepID=A0A2A9EQM8_9MICO|nr:MFS transporter [Georgenia soli]PFG41073.1 MFS transporter [Georgenia soli]